MNQRFRLSRDEAAKLADAFCPDCDAMALQLGPSAGLAQNVACRECGAEFVLVRLAPGMSTRTHEKGAIDRERLRALYGIEIETVI